MNGCLHHYKKKKETELLLFLDKKKWRGSVRK
jgi:hypothetical protein